MKDSKEMRDAMGILNEFSENRRNYLLYKSRLEGKMVRQTILTELEKAIVERETEKAEKEKERVEKEKALKENERLKKLLKKRGGGKNRGTRFAVCRTMAVIQKGAPPHRTDRTFQKTVSLWPWRF